MLLVELEHRELDFLDQSLSDALAHLLGLHDDALGGRLVLLEAPRLLDNAVFF